LNFFTNFTLEGSSGLCLKILRHLLFDKNHLLDGLLISTEYFSRRVFDEAKDQQKSLSRSSDWSILL